MLAGGADHPAIERISPAATRSKPAMQRSTVVLPQPEGPSRQPIRPFSRLKDSFWTIR